jgi:pyruvate/2-oxoglutarate dehydrogenase complex dihydrolipoamide dehydrogenase (E3) component
VAAGRVPNTDDLGLDSGLRANMRGYIATNDRLETDVPGIWALGDINQRGAFTHTSYHDHDVLAENLAGGQRSADARNSIYAMFTDPPLAHVGLYEADAKRLVEKEGRRISQAVHAMKDVSRAKEESETVGVIKLLIDEDSGLFLGATMLGIQADEIIQSIGLVMASQAPGARCARRCPYTPPSLNSAHHHRPPQAPGHELKRGAKMPINRSFLAAIAASTITVVVCLRDNH